MNATTTIHALWTAAHTQTGRLRANQGLKNAMLAHFRAQGQPFVPFGDGDAKTASPGTYRPVGDTCPPTCPYLGAGCYAEGGNVRLHQLRASRERVAALNSAGACFAWAALTGRVARLHVSGDFGQTVDLEYVAGLIALADAVNDRRQAHRGTAIAWTYTHHKYHAINPPQWVRDLSAAGIHVRASDRAGYNGAIVVPFDDIGRVRKATGARIAKCPAQLRDTNCNDCRLCWERPDVTIAFDPHGFQGKAAANNSPTRG